MPLSYPHILYDIAVWSFGIAVCWAISHYLFVVTIFLRSEASDGFKTKPIRYGPLIMVYLMLIYFMYFTYSFGNPPLYVKVTTAAVVVCPLALSFLVPSSAVVNNFNRSISKFKGFSLPATGDRMGEKPVDAQFEALVYSSSMFFGIILFTKEPWAGYSKLTNFLLPRILLASFISVITLKSLFGFF